MLPNGAFISLSCLHFLQFRLSAVPPIERNGMRRAKTRHERPAGKRPPNRACIKQSPFPLEYPSGVNVDRNKYLRESRWRSPDAAASSLGQPVPGRAVSRSGGIHASDDPGIFPGHHLQTSYSAQSACRTCSHSGLSAGCYMTSSTVLRPTPELGLY